MAYDAGGQTGPVGVPPATATDGVLSRRLFAYLIDLVVIFGLTVVLGLLVGIAGLVTFGAAWVLYAFLVPATAILYSAVTVGGAAQGTVGMRITGVVALEALTGSRPSMLAAGVHALIFYVGIGTLILLVLDIAVGLARDDRRLGHDLLAGLVFVRR